MSGCYRWEGDSLVLRVYVQPGAKRDELAGHHGDRLKIRIGAPARDGRANRGLLQYLAGLFGVRPARVRLLRGESSRDKTVAVDAPRRLIEGIERPAARQRP